MPSKKKKKSCYKYLQHLLCHNIVGNIEGTKKLHNRQNRLWNIYIIGQQMFDFFFFKYST